MTFGIGFSANENLHPVSRGWTFKLSATHLTVQIGSPKMRQIRHPSLDQTGVVPGGPQTVTGDTKLKIPASSSIKAAYPAKRIDISRPSDKTSTKQKKKNKRKKNLIKLNQKERKKEDSLLRSRKMKNRGPPARRPSSVRFPDTPSPLGSLVPTNDRLAILDGLRDCCELGRLFLAPSPGLCFSSFSRLGVNAPLA
ncbi:uncharacterized protein BO88DRAFT_404950 [Aspergillus vadensis CBS 113365]|uniref:Uncharacterized protein n=1 Tax=Aspergillus vadensis (strain CBS 113365 / IMI 142717 / IBT 24658) TaxID=1448311 RepID=A0A319CLP3_ASPVC|nr:hypothetical protein BO88DRAFT_404950 [Aspergillus vadensis CBS 113365]PYH69262.1 hypothetical protein BO88DRAFT_404950 [Aspergillus vadensis CBS 113365]